MTFDVNGKFIVSFEPDDTAFAQGVFDALVELDKQYALYKTKTLGCSNEQRYTITRDSASVMCDCIHNAVKYPVCDELLDNPSLLLFPADGTPMWFNIIYGFIEKIAVPRSWYCDKVINKYLKKRKCGDSE